MRISLAALVFVAACHHSSTSAPQNPATPHNTEDCGNIADHVITWLSKGDSKDSIAKDRAAIMQHCTQDVWTAEAKTCLLGASTIDAGNACEAKLTPQQKDQFEHDPVLMGDAPPKSPDNGAPGAAAPSAAPGGTP